MNETNKRLLERINEHLSKRSQKAQEQMWKTYEHCEPLDRPLLLTSFRPRFLAKFLNFDWDSVRSPDERISFFLQMELLRLENIIDDAPSHVPVVYPPYFDLERKGGVNILGGERKYDSSTGSFIDIPLINSKIKLENLRIPEPCFQEVSQEDAQQYEQYMDCVEGLLQVQAPDTSPPLWDPMFSPFGGVCKIVGHEKLLMDMHDDPGFVHAVMEWLCCVRIDYECKRAEILGHKLKESEKEWAEDDVNFPFISRKHYEEFVYPYEYRVATSIGNIHYHSCGNITPFVDLIAGMPEIVQIDVGAESSLKTAADLVRGKKIRLRKSPHVIKEILYSDESLIRKICRSIADDSAGTSICLLCEGFYDGTKDTFDSVIRFSGIAHDELTHYREAKTATGCESVTS
ncbi:MAG: uroporphyrinogen decarboxylase family protein [Sedimentisphaerales bacterium]